MTERRYIVGVDLGREPSRHVETIGVYDPERNRLTVVLPNPDAKVRVTAHQRKEPTP